MKGFRALAMLGAVALAAPSMTAQLTPSPQQLLAIEERRATKPVKKKKINLGLAEVTPKYRNRNKPPKRKLKRNLVTHSRRVRRKHRRARR